MLPCGRGGMGTRRVPRCAALPSSPARRRDAGELPAGCRLSSCSEPGPGSTEHASDPRQTAQSWQQPRRLLGTSARLANTPVSALPSTPVPSRERTVQGCEGSLLKPDPCLVGTRAALLRQQLCMRPRAAEMAAASRNAPPPTQLTTFPHGFLHFSSSVLRGNPICTLVPGSGFHSLVFPRPHHPE